MEQKLIKHIVKVGNSAGVLIPKKWLGGTAQVEIIKKPLNIKKDLMDLLSPYLNSIMGIYLVGSYARGEENESSDIDIIVISDNLNKEIISDKYHIFIYPLDHIKKTLERNPILIYPRIAEAKTILNKSLIEGLIINNLKKELFNGFLRETKSILSINKTILELDKESGDLLTSYQVVYSLILRLRGLIIIKCLLSKENYNNKFFKIFLNEKIGKNDSRDLYEIYDLVKNKKKVKIKLKISIVERLLNITKNELKKYAK